MHDYDIALKNILTRGASGFLSRLTGLQVSQWLNNELPEVRARRADLLGEASGQQLIHIELQSTNDPRMSIRMLEYKLAIESRFGRFPRQLVLYVGQAPLRMDGKIAVEGLSFECAVVDMRDLDGEPLLHSDSLDENIISILSRLSNAVVAVRRILEKIAASDSAGRAKAVKELTILAGLRNLAGFVVEETRKMPILNDMIDHEVFGPILQQGIATGRVEGRMEGREEGREEGERTIVRRLLTKKFGPIPEWAAERIANLDSAELERLSVDLLDAGTLEELFS